MNKAILASAPYAQRAAAVLAERERYQAQARAIGIEEGVIERMSLIAEQIGPRTLLPNGEVWRAVWGTMLGYAKQGEAPISNDRQAWAGDIWRALYYEDPPIAVRAGGLVISTHTPQKIGAFLSLRDALP